VGPKQPGTVVSNSFPSSVEAWLTGVAGIPAETAPRIAAALAEEEFDSVARLDFLDEKTLLTIPVIKGFSRNLILAALASGGAGPSAVPTFGGNARGGGLMSTVVPKRGIGMTGPKRGTPRGGLMSTAMPKRGGVGGVPKRGIAGPKRGRGVGFGPGAFGPGSGLPQFGSVVATRLLKKSGQANVYAGQKANYAGEVAIKVFHNASDWDDCKAELMAIMKIPEHPNLVAIVDFFEVPLPCLVMNLISGGDLRDFLNVHSEGMSGQPMRDVVSGIAHGLDHLHKAQVVHRGMFFFLRSCGFTGLVPLLTRFFFGASLPRFFCLPMGWILDMKSPNVMLDETHGNRPVLIDLGMGGRAHADDTMVTIAPKGTYLWMAPCVSVLLFRLCFVCTPREFSNPI
jgi:Protein tyrosine and serine/threonine kinase